MRISIKCESLPDTRDATDRLLRKGYKVQSNPVSNVIKVNLYRWELINLLCDDGFVYFKPSTTKYDLDYTGE